MVRRRGEWYAKEVNGTQKNLMVRRSGERYAKEVNGTQKRLMALRKPLT